MDFESYTSIDQFDMNKINQFSRLSSIPGFILLRSEQAYLDKYRELLMAQYDEQTCGSKKDEEEAEVAEEVEEEVEEEVKITKKSKKKTEE